MTTLAKVFSAELDGIEARQIEVETDLHAGLHSFTIVGLADKALSESKERINAALKNSGIKAPSQEHRRVVVNLAPADIKKTGSHYDLAIAVGYLLASGQLGGIKVDEYLLVGELALDGALRPMNGAMSIAKLAAQRGFCSVVVPAANAAEAAIIPGVRVLGAKSIQAFIDHVEGRMPIEPAAATVPAPFRRTGAATIADIKGQQYAKRALMIAAAGAHNLLLVGSPGAGKTMLAQAITSLLPEPTAEEIIEMTGIHSAAGILSGAPYVSERPFRSPHQTASPVSVFGGGQIPRPGEISLAHRGVLFLDELPEFRRDLLESLRQPLESGRATVNRVRGNLTFPARFMLVAAMNPCPCGYYGDSQRACTCAPYEVMRYQKKVSGPLLDRIDLHITVPRVSLGELRGEGSGEEFSVLRAQVVHARNIQQKRLRGRGRTANSEMSSKDVDHLVRVAPDAEDLIRKSFQKALLSARGYYRILKVAQTISDLESAPLVTRAHIAEAFNYRVRTLGT